jgi:protein-disulfide isomerase
VYILESVERFGMKRNILVLNIVVLFSIFGCTPAEQKDGDNVVIKSEAKTSAAIGPVIEVAETEIDLGNIPADVDEIVGSIFVFNNGSQTLQILKVHGPCSCFAGYSGDKIIEPGEGGEIEVKFDKNKIPAGSVKRVVNIETNDPSNKKVPVHFTFNVERSTDKEELRVLRSNISAMRRDVSRLRADMGKVLAELKSLKESRMETAGSPSIACGNCGKKHQAAKAKPKPLDTTIYDIPMGNSPVLGTKGAPVTITEFFDLQCPFCISEFQKIREMLKAYNGKVQVVFKHYPLAFHKEAGPAHAAVEFAFREKGNKVFWEMYHMIMSQPKKLEIPVLRGYAEKLALNLDVFDKVMADNTAIKNLLAADKALADKLGVRATPTVFINGLKLADRSIEGYKTRIDAILKMTN